MLHHYYLLIVLVVVQMRLSASMQDKSKQIIVVASSPSCAALASSSVYVNGTDYLSGFDGINIVVIETDKLVVATGNVNNEVKSVNASIKKFISDRVKKPGTVVVLTTQLTCFDDFTLWYNSLKTIDDLIVGEFSVGDIDDDTTLVIMACYVKCPHTIQGFLPISKFVSDDVPVKLEVTFGVNGYIPSATQQKNSSRSSTIIIVVVVVVILLVLIAIVVVVLCCWRRRRKTEDVSLICCFPKRMRKENDKEERVGLSTECEQQQYDQYTPINSCLMQEQEDSYTTLEKKEIPKAPYQIGRNRNEKKAENLYYTPQGPENAGKTADMDLYEPFSGDENNQIPQPSPRDVVITKSDGDNIIYKTPSNIPTLKPNAEQHYQTPNKIEKDAQDGYQREAGHGRKMFRRDENNLGSGEKEVELSDSHTYKTPKSTVTDNNHNIYQQPKKHETLTTPSTPSMQSSPGTSHRLFQQHQQNDSDDDEGDFASYTKLNEDDNVIYKTPSNVSRYDPPKSVPQSIYQIPTNIDATGAPDTNIYDPVDMETGHEEDENYENTSFLKR